MTGKNLYDILGISPTATISEIREAYLLRSKMLHPDRFDQTRQAAEWQMANEMFKELNRAYGILREVTSRSDYDRLLREQSKHKADDLTSEQSAEERKAVHKYCVSTSFYSAVTCFLICVSILPSSCMTTRLVVVKQGWIIDDKAYQDFTDWSQVAIYTLVYCSITFIVAYIKGYRLFASSRH